MAPPTFFSSKAGRNGADLKPKTKVGVISKKKKKKKKGHRLLVPRFVSFASPNVDKSCYRAGVDLFFFFFFLRSP